MLATITKLARDPIAGLADNRTAVISFEEPLSEINLFFAIFPGRRFDAGQNNQSPANAPLRHSVLMMVLWRKLPRTLFGYHFPPATHTPVDP